ncbi:neuromedin-U receptor 1-like [Phyllopteryx taeniolatus]|uniref:neuromedin-U receptor 1-like n=1 Tax=Phyllopteryx taeniolatus TaxID=161469 RepID=UPI002AD44620|nr:neuromedin-U receptor 1-like [Phyllopteryx taeniolatus]
MTDVLVSRNDTETKPDVLLAVSQCTVLVFALVLGLPGNVWVCWVVFRTKSLRTSDNALLVSLAASDLLKCSVDAPLLLASFLQRARGERLPASACASQHLTWASCGCVQLLTLAGISVERYQAVAFPFRTRRRRARVRLWIVFIWLCGPASALLSLTLSERPLFYALCRPAASYGHAWPRHPDPFGPYVLVPVWVSSLTVIVIHYGRIVAIVRKHRKKAFNRGIRVMPAVSRHAWRWSGDSSGRFAGRARGATPEIAGAVCLLTPGARERGKKRMEGKLAKRFGYMIVAFALCWLPMVLILIIKHLVARPDADGLLLEMETSAMVLTCVQAALDPLIYTLVTRQFRFELSKMFLSIRRCPLNLGS